MATLEAMEQMEHLVFLVSAEYQVIQVPMAQLELLDFQVLAVYLDILVEVVILVLTAQMAQVVLAE